MSVLNYIPKVFLNVFRCRDFKDHVMLSETNNISGSEIYSLLRFSPLSYGFMVLFINTQFA